MYSRYRSLVGVSELFREYGWRSAFFLFSHTVVHRAGSEGLLYERTMDVALSMNRLPCDEFGSIKFLGTLACS